MQKEAATKKYVSIKGRKFIGCHLKTAASVLQGKFRSVNLLPLSADHLASKSCASRRH
jgi:hypothetical protein